ncbi:MAG: hypothetical protein KC800_14210, partial [Candidatus Eremiobacteraeota bacterium]|nr:hypothetical protein [Candidatus Eremiobacteraeota bacterium]
MQINSTRLPVINRHASTPQAGKSEASVQAPVSDSFTFSGSKGRTSVFHRLTGGVAGGAVGAVAGALLLASAGNGKGADGLIYPLIGLAGGGAAGLVGGAYLAGTVDSSAEKT